MQAFHNDPAIKQKFLDRAIFHQNADHLMRGVGWESNGKTRGCAIGCLLEKYDHKAFETEGLGPEWLGRLVDTLFEGMSEEKSRTWPEVYVRAVREGADLEKVKDPFTIYVLESCLESMNKVVFEREKFPEVEKAINGSKAAVLEMIRIIREQPTDESARAAARAAADAAADAAALAAWAADAAALAARAAARAAAWAAWAARAAADAAADAAAWAAWAARAAADAAADAAALAAWAADAAALAAWAAWAAADAAAAWAAWAALAAADAAADAAAAFDRYADKLIELIRGCE